MSSSRFYSMKTSYLTLENFNKQLMKEIKMIIPIKDPWENVSSVKSSKIRDLNKLLENEEQIRASLAWYFI